MKKKSIAITVILALLLMMFSATAVLAEDDSHGADAHSESMYEMEDDVAEQEELSFADQIINTLMTYLPYVIGVICGLVVLIVIIKMIRRSSKPKYTGRH